jgi:hypothetical protein
MPMLYRMADIDTTAPSITGRTIARGRKSKSQKAALAAMILLGELKLDNLTKKQIAKLLGVSESYVGKALSLDAADREAMAEGRLTLAAVPTNPTDKEIEKTVRAAGVDRVWAAMEPLI